MLLGFGGRGQNNLYDASGAITSGGTAQLVLPVSLQRTSFLFQNISDTDMYVDFGSARATATLSSGTVASCAVTNAGVGFSKAPLIDFRGGGNTGNNQNNPTAISASLPDYPAPASPAKGRCVMTGSAPNMTVASITIDDPGSGYGSAPVVFIYNDPNDPYGAAAASTTSGYLIPSKGTIQADSSVCPTDQVSVYCITTGKAFICKYTV